MTDIQKDLEKILTDYTRRISKVRSFIASKSSEQIQAKDSEKIKLVKEKLKTLQNI